MKPTQPTPAPIGQRQATSPLSDARQERHDAQADPDNPFRAGYRDASYYSTGRSWNDYAPAYRYGEQAFARHSGKRFDEVESTLAQDWNAVKEDSRLSWVEARNAVRDAWKRARDQS